MASEASNDEAHKARIIKHMNKDHSESLSLFLQHYRSLSQSSALTPTLTDLDFTALKILDRAGEIHRIDIHPPLTSWVAIRPTVVAMDAQCRAGLGAPPSHHALDTSTVSDEGIQITRYIAPQTLLQRTILCFCVLTFVLFLARQSGFLVSGSYIYKNVLVYWPFGSSPFSRADNFLRTVDFLALPVYLLHVAEAVALDLVRLQRYAVRRGSRVWWAWIGSCLLEGWGCWDRTAKEVRRLKQEKAKTT